jgi:lipopolysaccharide transport system ATP-binding protein
MTSEPASEVVIKVEGLGKRYPMADLNATGKSLREELSRALDPRRWFATRVAEGFVALQDVSFTVARGERLAILGLNGAGKSTLLKIISRITLPTSGSIGIRGRFASILEIGTGFHPDLSGRENVYLNGSILGLTRDAINARFAEIVDFAGIGAFIDEPVKHYSSGMYVRLAFAIAAHLDPDILIVDEVLAVGDAEFRAKCLERMRRFTADARRTIILVSHDAEIVRSFASRCLLIQGGRLVGDGPPEAMLRRLSPAS